MNAEAVSGSAPGGATAAPGTTLDVRIRSRLVLRVLLGCILALVLAGTAFVVLAVGLGHQSRVARLFDLNAELAIPAYFASLMLLAAGCLLGLIALEQARSGGAWRRHWALLALGFVWLAFDEGAQVHEALNPALRGRFGLGGLGGIAWIVPALAAVAGLAVLYLPFVRALPRRYLRLFLGSGLLYLAGALGLEAVGGALRDHYGRMSWAYQAEVVVEEALEMLGAAYFIHALLLYLAERGLAVRLLPQAVPERQAQAPSREGRFARSSTTTGLYRRTDELTFRR
jgi:hypothetical protein